MVQTLRKIIFTVVALAVLVGIGWAVKVRLDDAGNATRVQREASPAPVEVAPIERGRIELRRTFSGTLEASARFVVSPKVGGRIERLAVDLADPTTKGQVVAQLDDDEYEQASAQAEAELAVAHANRVQAQSALGIAQREMQRIETLRTEGVASDSQYDAAKAEQSAAEAALAVAKAQARRAESAIETARIRRAYTQVKATWNEDDKTRFVAERFVEEGDTVTANTPLLSIVRLDPIKGVVFVTEKDYARLSIDQQVTLSTDAFPGRQFKGTIARIAPIFQQSSRQARVELAIDNPSGDLKPGMFIRARIILAIQDDAVVVPVASLVTRDNQTGVFVVSESDKTVQWKPVTVGIQEGERVQVFGDGLEGRVVTLGQQLIDEGSKVTIPADEPQPTERKESS